MNLTLSNPRKRRVGLSVLIGLLSGLIGGFTKWGWEIPFPPRDPGTFWPPGADERVTPPKVFLDMLGLPSDWSYVFSGMDLPLSVFIVHMGFSVVVALVYCVAAEFWPKIKMGCGTVFGIVSNTGGHIIVMPLMGLVPPLLDIPFDEQFSEFFGHIWWMFTVEMSRHYLRHKITGYAAVEDE